MRHLKLLMAVCAVFAIAGCDSNSPVQPHWAAPTHLSLSAVASGIAASAVSPSEIDLSWASSPSASGYQVFRSDHGATGGYSLIASTAAAVSTYANLGLTGSTKYCYEIRSFKTAGKNTTYSAYSDAVCATTLAPPPPPVSAPSDVDVVSVPDQYFLDVGGSPIRVSWRDNSANEDGFRLERASIATGPWTQAATTAVNVTSLYQYAIREQQVCFRVIAFIGAGESTASPADCTTPPGNPTNLVARATDRQSITLTWTDNSAFEDGYKLSRLDAAGNWNDLVTLGANAVSYRDPAVTTDMTYTYRVQALKDGGLSDYSNESAAVIPTTRPAAPISVDASYWADNEYGWLYFGAAWVDASNNEDGFRVESSGDGVSGWQPYATVAANATSFQEKLDLWASLWPHAGCYRVVAFNDAGESAPSNVTCTEWFNPATNLIATAVDQQSIDLSWTDTGFFERGYLVLRSTTVDGSYDFVDRTSANATSYHDSGLAGGQEYWYIVVSDFGGYSIYDAFNYSDRVSATTLSAAGAMQSSRTVINSRLSAIRIRGGPTPAEVRVGFKAAHTSSAIGGAWATPKRVKRPVQKVPGVRGQ